jgi:hypothetical protein
MWAPDLHVPHRFGNCIKRTRHAAKTLTARNGRGSEMNIVTAPIISAIH